jgi:hypothetical protein
VQFVLLIGRLGYSNAECIGKGRNGVSATGNEFGEILFVYSFTSGRVGLVLLLEMLLLRNFLDAATREWRQRVHKMLVSFGLFVVNNASLQRNPFGNVGFMGG